MDTEKSNYNTGPASVVIVFRMTTALVKLYRQAKNPDNNLIVRQHVGQERHVVLLHNAIHIYQYKIE